MRLWLGALSIAATGCLASVRSDDRTAYGLPRTALQTDDHLHLGFLPGPSLALLSSALHMDG